LSQIIQRPPPLSAVKPIRWNDSTCVENPSLPASGKRQLGLLDVPAAPQRTSSAPSTKKTSRASKCGAPRPGERRRISDSPATDQPRPSQPSPACES
jgi:hypothetical protein